MTLEGIAALAVAFVLLAVIVQVSFVVIARNAAASAAAASARRLARPATQLDDAARSLEHAVVSTVPGARDVTVSLERTPTEAVATVHFRWDPPGPRLIPITITVGATAPVAVPP